MTNLQIIKSETFGTVQCDFYQGQNEVWMSRRQIGETLGYSNPNDAIKDIHNRHKDRLDKHSRVVRIAILSGGTQSTTVYSAKGIYEICRWSKQSKANAFYDWVYEVLENLRKGEQVKQVEATEARRLRAEAMNMNAKTRQAKMIMDLVQGSRDTLSSGSIQTLIEWGAELLIGKPIVSLTEIEKTYTVSDIANELGISTFKLSRMATFKGLNTKEHGITVISKSPYSDQEVSAFMYNENGRAKLIESMK